MDPDKPNCVLLGIHVDKKKFLARPSSGKLVQVWDGSIKRDFPSWLDLILRSVTLEAVPGPEPFNVRLLLSGRESFCRFWLARLLSIYFKPNLT